VLLREESEASEELVPLVLLRSAEVEEAELGDEDVALGDEEDVALRLVSLASDESVLAVLARLESFALKEPLPLTEPLALPLPLSEPLVEALFAVFEDAVLFCVLKSDGELEVEDALLVGLDDVELYDVLLLLLILVFEVVLLLAEPEPESEPLAEVEPLAP